jgi:hypothetical protein
MKTRRVALLLLLLLLKLLLPQPVHLSVRVLQPAVPEQPNLTVVLLGPSPFLAEGPLQRRGGSPSVRAPAPHSGGDRSQPARVTPAPPAPLPAWPPGAGCSEAMHPTRPGCSCSRRWRRRSDVIRSAICWILSTIRRCALHASAASLSASRRAHSAA